MDGSGCDLGEAPGFRAEAKRTGNNSVTVRLLGELGIASAGAARRALEQLYAGIWQIVLDLSHITDRDATRVRFLLTARRQARTAGTDLIARYPSTSVQRVLAPGTRLRSAGAADDAFPVQWTGQQAVVMLPRHIDHSNTDQVRDQLLRIINRGAAVLIADLTGTASCDYSGAYALARAQHRAIASGTALRLVATGDVARRVFTLNALDRPVEVYPDLDRAIAAGAEGHALHADEEPRAQAARPGLTAGAMSNVGPIVQRATNLPPDGAASSSA